MPVIKENLYYRDPHGVRDSKPREFNIESIKMILKQNQVILDMNMLLLRHLAEPPVVNMEG